MDIESDSTDSSKGNAKHIGNQRKGDPCFIVAENMAELCSTSWKAEL